MEIQQTDNHRRGSFFIEINGKKMAEMTYVLAGAGIIIIEHTEVDDALRGKSAGKQLVAQAVAFAREKGIKIKPLCPFAKSVFDKIDDYHDVLKN